MKKSQRNHFNFKNISSEKLALIFSVLIVLMLVATYYVYSYYFAETVESTQINISSPSSSPTSIGSPSPSLSPTPLPSKIPAASAKPATGKLFKFTAPLVWDTQKVTRYAFSAYVYEPVKTMTIKFDDKEYELTPESHGHFAKVIDIKVGQTVITATAVAVSGRTETQSYTVTKNNTLFQVDPKLNGVQCDGAKLDECKNYSGYSPGRCNKYNIYLECLKTKCDVNTLIKDSYCKSQIE